MYWFHCWGVRLPAVEQIQWMAYWTFRFQSRVVPSSLPLASVCVSGLNATESTAAVLPVRGWPSGRGRAGSATSHSRTPPSRSEEHTSELQSRRDLVCRLLLEKKKKNKTRILLRKKKRKTIQKK